MLFSQIFDNSYVPLFPGFQPCGRWKWMRVAPNEYSFSHGRTDSYGFWLKRCLAPVSCIFILPLKTKNSNLIQKKDLIHLKKIWLILSVFLILALVGAADAAAYSLSFPDPRPCRCSGRCHHFIWHRLRCFRSICRKRCRIQQYFWLGIGCASRRDIAWTRNRTWITD